MYPVSSVSATTSGLHNAKSIAATRAGASDERLEATMISPLLFK
jgi:hypothetical protein